MPRIKAYKGNRSIIPVSTAKLGTAFLCPWTAKIFGTKRQYVTHLKALRGSRMHARARVVHYNRIRENFNNQPTFEKVIEWIELHPEFFFDTYVMRDPFLCHDYSAEKLAVQRENFEIKIVGLSLRWNPNVSNTHHCPHNGVTNWGGRKESAPHGYPGWYGRIEFTTKIINPDTGTAGIRSIGGRCLEGTGVHTGTGGGGDVYGYEAMFFDADWPEIAYWHDKVVVMDALKGKVRNPGNNNGPHHFRYSSTAKKETTA